MQLFSVGAASGGAGLEEDMIQRREDVVVTEVNDIR